MLSDENIDSCDDLDEDEEGYDYDRSKRDKEIGGRVEVLRRRYRV